MAGRLPLWNHFEGLGAPLLGEMQSAALFPPTWLLILPHGQAVEQALLQFVAGLGTVFFLRRFTLGAAAGLAGGLLFEVNGVFSWLRNAVTNPVALLPWLFFAVESLRASALTEASGRGRAVPISQGAVAAALALYAGFPEEVYLYGLLLITWTLFRASSLSWHQIGRFAVDLLLTGLVAVALSAPLLVAFADYIHQAEVGIHGTTSFEFSFYDGAGLIQYLVPYVYGTIFGSPEPSVVDIWSGTGGYIGFVPVVLAVAALLTPHRRPAKLVLAGWIVLALGATHGVWGLQDIFHVIPLMGVVAFGRYLNASWIFCFVVLAALFLDDATAMAPSRLRLTLRLGLACALACLALALAVNGTMIGDLWAASSQHRAAFAIAAASTGVLSILLCVISLIGDAGVVVSSLCCVMLLEATAWFAIPYFSYPRHGRLDLDLVDFLRNQTGDQRVVGFEATGLYPNYGSAIGVALLNYDDLPSPSLTASYVRSRLDPYTNPTSFVPMAWGLTPEQRLDRRNGFYARLDAYGASGVRFVMGAPGFERVPPYEIEPAGDGSGVSLVPGGQIALIGHIAPSLALPVSAISVALQREQATSGHIEAVLCSDADCASGLADLGTARDETPTIVLDHEISLPPGSSYTLRFTRPDGIGPIALPLHRIAASQATVDVQGVSSGAPDVRFTDARLSLAYSGRSARVYRLRDVQPYLSAPGCRLTSTSRDDLTASCARPSRLTRLELAMGGWSARVDDTPVPIVLTDSAFQAIDLPAGNSRIAFSYAPRGFAWACAALIVALVTMVAAVAGAPARPLRMRSS